VPSFSGFAIVDKLTRLLGMTIDDTVRLAGDPEKLLSELIVEMTNDLVVAKNHLAQLKKDERRLAQEIELVSRAAGEWDQRAKSAVRAGDDVVATDALLRKRQNEVHAATLESSLRKQRRDADHLMNALVALNIRIEEAKHKRNAILLRADRTEQKGTIAEVIGQSRGVEASEVLDRIDRRMAIVEDDAGLLPELSDEAIATSSAASDDAPRPEVELQRLKRAVTQPDRKNRKPLAKTRGREHDPGKSLTRESRGSPRDRAKAAGQKRTKR
jgi:phage shock protein A